MIWKERGVKMKKIQKPRKNRKTGAVIVILLGLLCAVSTVRSCGTKRAAIQGKVDDVVYVGQGSYDPANDGKIVIVCGELKVLEPAYDDELGLTIYAPRAMRSAKKMKLKKWNLPATEENMEWNSDLGVGGMEIFQGAADVGDYHLSEEFIEQLMLGREYEFDEETLSEAGLAILTDRKYRGEKFIGTQRMGREIFEEGDRRYQYSVPYQSDGDMVTVIGIQEQGTLTYVKGATPNMLSGELDKKTALQKSGMSSGGVSIFRVVLTILLLSTGIRMLLKKRDQKKMEVAYEKGKKGWLLLMAFTTWAALIAGCGKWTGNKQDKVPEVTMAGSDTENMENPENSQSTPLPDIKELTYYVHGTMMEPIRSVSLIRHGEKALVRIEPWDGEEEELFDYPVDAETLDQARRVLETYDVASWAGFRGSNPNVLDGYSMSFQVKFVDGSRIEAFGENKFPKNYHDVFSELDDLTVEAKDAFYEEQSFLGKTGSRSYEVTANSQ